MSGGKKTPKVTTACLDRAYLKTGTLLAESLDQPANLIERSVGVERRTREWENGSSTELFRREFESGR
jgi:hypothetical protein